MKDEAAAERGRTAKLLLEGTRKNPCPRRRRQAAKFSQTESPKEVSIKKRYLVEVYHAEQTLHYDYR